VVNQFRLILITLCTGTDSAANPKDLLIDLEKRKGKKEWVCPGQLAFVLKRSEDPSIIQRALSLVPAIGKESLATSVADFTSLISVLAKRGMLNDAFKVFHEMTEVNEVRPNTVTFNALIDGCARYTTIHSSYKHPPTTHHYYRHHHHRHHNI